MQQLFYVYVDYTLEDSPRPFYVGMGNQGRARLLRRNKKHTWVTKQHGQQRTIIFETDIREYAIAREIELIKELDTFNPNIKDYTDIRCNRTRGGEGAPGYKFTSEQRQRQASAIKIAVNKAGIQEKRRQYLKQRYADPIEHEKTSNATKRAYDEKPEVHQHLSEALIKMWSDPEHHARHAKANKCIWNDPKAHENASAALKKSYAENPERHKKLSNSLQNFYRKHPERCVQIEQRSLSGELIATYASLSDAVRQTGISNITACCKGRRSQAGGFCWNNSPTTCTDMYVSGSMVS